MVLRFSWPFWLPASGVAMVAAGTTLWWFGATFDGLAFDTMRLDAQDARAPAVAIFTRLGGLTVLGPLALAVVGWLYLSGRRGEAAWLLMTIAGGRLMVEAMKLIFARPRPPLADQLALVTSHSFPSSHSAGTMLTCLAIAMLFPGRSRTAIRLAIAAACAIGWSRIALGVHWPSDVLAGLGFGMLWVGIARRWLPG